MTKIQFTAPNTFQIEIANEKSLTLTPVKTFGNFWGRILYFLHLAGVSKIVLEGNKTVFVSKKSFLEKLSKSSETNLKEKINWRKITGQTLDPIFQTANRQLTPVSFQEKSSINANEKLTSWVKRTYQPQAIIYQNLEKAIEHFQLENAQLIGIRGDGNCTFRAIAVGLLTLAAQEEKEGIHALYTQIEEMKTSLKEKELAPIKKALLKNLLALENSPDVQDALSEALLAENAPLLESFIAFLRAKASFFHIEHWASYDEDKRFQLQGLHELDDPSKVIDHLKEKSYKDPKEGDPRFFGNPADLEAISALFKVILSSIKIEETYLQPDFSSTFVEYGQKEFAKKLTLLNRPGHTDLIL